MEVHDTLQETGIKTIPKKKKCNKAKWLTEEALQIVEERREMKGKGEKERESVYNVSKERLLRGPQCGVRTQPSLAACEASVRAPPLPAQPLNQSTWTDVPGALSSSDSLLQLTPEG